MAERTKKSREFGYIPKPDPVDYRGGYQPKPSNSTPPTPPRGTSITSKPTQSAPKPNRNDNK